MGVVKLYFKIKYRIRDSHTNERIGFVLQNLMSQKLTIVQLEQALYLASNQVIMDMGIGTVNGKVSIVSKGKIKLSNIEEVTIEQAKQMIEPINNSFINIENIFIVSVYKLCSSNKITAVKLSDTNSSRVYHMNYIKNRTDFAYSFVSSEDLDIANKHIKAGTIFFMQLRQLQQEFSKALNSQKGRFQAGNFCLVLQDNPDDCGIITIDSNVNVITVGKYDPINRKYVWDTRLKQLYNPEFLNDQKIEVREAFGDKQLDIHALSEVSFKLGVLYSCSYIDNLAYDKKQYELPINDNTYVNDIESNTIKSRMPEKSIDHKLFKLLKSHSFQVASSRYTGIQPNGNESDSQYSKEVKKKLNESTSKGLIGLINIFKR